VSSKSCKVGILPAGRQGKPGMMGGMMDDPKIINSKRLMFIVNKSFSKTMDRWTLTLAQSPRSF